MTANTDMTTAAATLGRKGGIATSPAKTTAARENAKKGGRPAKGAYDSTFHRDGSVTVWDVHNQGWIRTSNPSDRLLATLSSEEREKIEAHTA